MRKIVLSLICIFFVSLVSPAQDILGAMVIDPTPTNVRQSPNGKIVMTLNNDCSYIVTLSEPVKGWWHLLSVENAEEAIDIELTGSTTGNYWIHYSVVSLATRNYGNERWCLRSNPREKSKAVYYFDSEILLHPLQIKGEWIKVITSDGKHTGWIKEEQICYNPLTNCC